MVPIMMAELKVVRLIRWPY